jgi:hypothetical protein
MDVSPIQRLAITANHATRPVEAVRPAPPVAPAPQASPAPADQEATYRNANTDPSTRVVVAWHAATLGYVTRVVDQHTGSVVYQTPPQQVLAMVEKFLDGLQGVTG